MPSSTWRHASSEAHERRRVLAQWTGVLAGPLVWLALLEWSFIVFPRPCEDGGTWWRHLPVAAGLVAVGLAGFWAWREGRRAHDRTRQQPYPTDAQSAPVSPETCDIRARWMTDAATAMSVWFILVILSLEVPVLVLGACN
jgi:hypothetical protein